MTETPELSDVELIELVRAGEIAAYGQLYERHVPAAYNLARQLCRSGAEADDLVSETFAKVLDTLLDGRGPTRAFRAYLLTALRHTAYDRTKAARKVQLVEDVQLVPAREPTAPVEDAAVDAAERTLAAKAFARLPENWRKVLWLTQIQGRTAAETAPLLGLTPNAVAALSYRARAGLRMEYLNAHLAEVSDERCRPRPPGWVTGPGMRCRSGTGSWSKPTSTGAISAAR